MLPELATGGASLIGGLITNEQNKREAQRNRDFQQWMSDTAHQREVKDLRAAGLNPILSARHGGASTPSGSMAQFENAIQSGVTSGLETARVKKEIRAVASQEKLNESLSTSAQAQAMAQQATAKEAITRTKALEAQMRAIEARAKADEKEARWDEKTLEPRYINRMLQEGLGTANSAKDLLNPFFKQKPIDMRSERERYNDAKGSKDAMERFYYNKNKNK